MALDGQTRTVRGSGEMDNRAMSISPAPPVQPCNPLHGLAQRIPLRCFTTRSIGSSLRFLRKTPWAREKLVSLYLFMRREVRRAAPRTSR